jgi:acetoin utilization deacetylase AcuC-like enzyme
MLIFHDPRCVEYSAPGHPERSARITQTVPLLKQRHPDWQWREPRSATDEELLRAHSTEHLQRVAKPLRDFDVDTPAYPKINFYARQSAGAAIEAARAALAGDRVFVLNRPPGHHAMRDRAMGFSYYGNIAIAALDTLASAKCQSDSQPRSATAATTKIDRVAIWDFDAHHGNGTEDIVAHNPQIRFGSIHQFPAYPGTGAKSFDNIYNYPVPPNAPRAEYMNVCRHALDKLLEWKPDLLLVSAGFDAYMHDPLVQMTLEQEDFATFGKWLRDVDVPTAAILEGGYSDDLPDLIDAFLTAWELH